MNTAPMAEVPITAQQEKLWDDTRVALLWHCPAFTHIFYNMMNKAGSKHIARFTRDIPAAATDGEIMLVNPDVFFKWPMNERTFVTAHEIAHCMFNHLVLAHKWNVSGKVRYADGTSLPYDHKLMNIAMDLVINDMLLNCKDNSGKPMFAMPKKDGKDYGWHNTDLGKETDSVVDVYKKVFEEAKKNSGGKGNGSGQPSSCQGDGFDQHLAPGQGNGKDPTVASQERNESAWGTAIQAAANAAKVQGKLPAGLQRLIDDLAEPTVPWQEHIQSLFARKVGSGSYDWRRADRRLIVRDIYAPGRSGFGAGTVVVGCDTSGSIGDETVAMFFAEMAGLLEDVKPKRLVIMWSDAKVHRVDDIEEACELADVKKKGAPGGGGTSFIPVFDEIAAMGIEPDALVYLTDLYGSFPSEEPKYPVIWGSISKGVTAPFGDVVEIPQQARVGA